MRRRYRAATWGDWPHLPTRLALGLALALLLRLMMWLTGADQRPRRK
jgi:hypothetical protein